MGLQHVESIYRSNTLYLTKFQTYKISYHPEQNMGGQGSQTPAAKSLYGSIFKKSGYLGFGVLIDIWSMATYMSQLRACDRLHLGRSSWTELSTVKCL